VSSSAKQPSSLSREQLDARALAGSRRSAMRHRVHRIRRAIAGLAAALFAAAFLGVYVQLASGHDPALSTKKPTTMTTTMAAPKKTAVSQAASSGSSSAEPSESTSESSSSASKESTRSTSAVTTSQS
jgi:hypothetical protein